MVKDTPLAATVVLLLACSSLTAAQFNNGYPNQYVTYNPQQPTFSDLNTFTTPYPFNVNGYNGQNQNQIRIWPYVIGQYLSPQSSLYDGYSNSNNLLTNNNNNLLTTNNNNLLATSNNNLGWGAGNTQQSWYNTLYPYRQVKK